MNLLKTSEKSKRRKQAKKTSEENKQRKQAKKTSGNIAKIYEYLAQHGEAKTNEIADYIGLSPARTRAIISEMENIERIGTNTNRKYKLKKLMMIMEQGLSDEIPGQMRKTYGGTAQSM